MQLVYFTERLCSNCLIAPATVTRPLVFFVVLVCCVVDVVGNEALTQSHEFFLGDLHTKQKTSRLHTQCPSRCTKRSRGKSFKRVSNMGSLGYGAWTIPCKLCVVLITPRNWGGSGERRGLFVNFSTWHGSWMYYIKLKTAPAASHRWGQSKYMWPVLLCVCNLKLDSRRICSSEDAVSVRTCMRVVHTCIHGAICHIFFMMYTNWCWNIAYDNGRSNHFVFLSGLF